MNTLQFHIVLAAALVVGATAVPCHSENLHLDAEEAAQMAVRASTLTAAAADRVEASQSTVKAADAARLPVLTANAGYIRHSAVPEFGVPTENPNEPVFILFPNIQNHYRVDLSVSQPIYTGGAISASREAARTDESAASWSETLSTLDLSNHARMLYWSAVAAAAGVDVAEAQLKRTRRLLDDARALREAGMAVNADVFAAEARFSAAEVDIIRTRNEEAQALTRLQSLLGIAPGTMITLEGAGTAEVPPPPPPRVDLEGDALDNRPELKITDAYIEGLGARARSVNAARKPTVAATGQYLLARPNQRFLPPVDERNDSWSVGVAASWQFFDGSRTKEQVATVHAEQRAMQQDRGELERQIRLEVATARLELESALKAIASADASAAAAEAWEESSSERYAAGIAMLSELLDAQADLAAAEMAQVRSRASAWLADAALRRAVGR
jgi:outer membrane protein TolC